MVHATVIKAVSGHKKRVIGYDVARAIAVFGMVVVNFKIVMGLEQADPHWLLEAAGLLEGRAAALFVVLAGVGLSLLSRSARLADDAMRLAQHRNNLLKRALFLFVVGLLYTPVWPADILHFYGLYITIGAFVLASTNRRLWLLAGILTVTFVVLVVTLDYEREWDWESLTYHGLWTPAGLVRHMLFNGFHPVIPWTAFLLVGMVLGRLDMQNPRTRLKVMLWGGFAAIFAELTSSALIRILSIGTESSQREIIQALFGTAPMPPMPLYIIAGAGVAAVVISGCVALTEMFRDAKVWKPLVATGQLALTLYVAHVVIGMGTLFAVGRLEGQSVPFGLGSAAVFCTVAMVFANWWRQRFDKGPLETVMRRVTDGQVRGIHSNSNSNPK